MKTTVYKIVGLDGENNLSSLIVFGKARKTYEPGIAHRAPKWLAGMGYHLIAFDRLENALHFTRKWRNASFRIWECEATGVFGDLPKPLSQFDLCEGKIILPATGLWPRGTVMCKTLKLVREVKC